MRSGSRYRKLESLLSDLYQSPLCACPEHLAHDSEPANPFTDKDIQAAFNVVHRALKMTPELLSERPIRQIINKTADYFSGAISERMPSKMADALRNDLYIFSGFKTYHELKEASERLLRPDGSLKSFKEFYQDTLKVRDKYNKAWLKAEYNYAVRTADAAARWAEIEKDKEHIDLLYETVGDGRVRPDHAALEGVCLPVDDPFWAIAYPPNGWNCRCRVLRVAKGSHPYSNSNEATDAYLDATAGKNELFRYNPGKEQRIFSDRHPYYSKRGIRHCAINGDKLAANLDNNEECEVLRNLINAQQRISLTEEQKAHRKQLQKEAIQNYKGMTVHNEIDVMITARGIKEYINQPHQQYFLKNELVRDLPSLIREAEYVAPFEPKRADNGVTTHLFRVKIDDKISYLIVNENNNEECTFHSISDTIDPSQMTRKN